MKNKVEIENTFHEAEKLRIKGNLKLAIKLFQNILNENPNFPPALNNIANCYFQLNEIGYAEKFYLKCLKIQPEQVQTLNNLALLYFRNNKFEKALPILKTSFLKKSNQEDVAEKIAYCLLELNLKEETHKFCEDALKSFKNNNKILFSYRTNLFKLGKNKEGLSVLQKETGLIEFGEDTIKII